MARMATLSRRPSGVYEVRRRVPLHAQAALGKKELRWSLNTQSLPEAKRRAISKLAEMEARFADAGQLVELSHKDIAGLAGHWLKTQLREREGNLPDLHGIELMLDSHELADENGRWAQYMSADADALLEREGYVAVSTSSRTALSERLFPMSLTLWQVLASRHHGDYTPPQALLTAPEWRGKASIGTTGGDSMAAMWELWKNDVPARSPKTVYGWSRRWAKLIKFLGHSEGARITTKDVRGWMKALSDDGASPQTVNGYLGAASAVFSVSVSNGAVSTNPFKGVHARVDQMTLRRNKRQAFSDDEAVRYLHAARERGGWVRWAVFVMAYTGARLEEVTDADVSAVRLEKGVHVLDLTPDGTDRSLKTVGSFRVTPLHSALVTEGFVAYARSLANQSGPLFPELSLDAFGKRSTSASKVLARMLRLKLGITDRRKVGGHSWRHRLITLCREHHIPEGAAKELCGHAAEGEHAQYGHHPLSTLAEYIERIPVQG